MKINTAMIFAAGFGTRMGALTAKTPKPMLPLFGRPMIDHCVDLLNEAGVERIFANTHYLHNEIEPHLERLGVTALRETTILETGGGLKAALPHIGNGPVVTINPDVFWRGENPVTALIAAWKPEMSALLMLHETGAPNDNFSLEHGQIRRIGPNKYTGLQIIRTERLNDIRKSAFSLNEYWDHLMANDRVHGMTYRGTWTDVGTQENLERLNERGLA